MDQSLECFLEKILSHKEEILVATYNYVATLSL